LASTLKKIETFLVNAFRRAHLLAQRRLATGQRAALGVVFIVGGAFGFLPVLGFWMIPVGVFLILLEFPAARRWAKAWLYRRKRHLARERHAGTPSSE
jgi:hypothetical protein